MDGIEKRLGVRCKGCVPSNGSYSTISNSHFVNVILSSGCESAYVCKGSSDYSFRWSRTNPSMKVDAMWLSTYMNANESHIIFGPGAAARYPASTFINTYVIMEQRPALLI